MELTVVIHREPDGFWSEVDELPGCFASGRTLEELTEALGEAVGLYLGNGPLALRGEPLRVGTVTLALDQPADRS
jgi:predicted RNase H-like HicB family nuclease